MENISPSGSNSKIVVAVVILIVVIAAAGAVWWYLGRSKEEPAPEPIKTAEDVAEAVTTPEIEVGSNPVENKVPEVNPVDRANPFKDAYQNPFE